MPTHILSGWCVANCFPLSPRQRLLCMFAAALPDLDGLGIVFGEATYQTYHHLLGHNLLFIVATATVCAALSLRNHITVFVLCAALGHLHLVMDYFGSGPLWPIYYLWPIDGRFKFVNPHAWEFFSWQNISIAGAFIVWTVIIAIRQQRTPIELLAPRLDRQFVDALRLRSRRAPA